MKRRSLGVLAILAIIALAVPAVFAWRCHQRKNELAAIVERYDELCRYVAIMYGLSAAAVERQGDKDLVNMIEVQGLIHFPATILDDCSKTTPLDSNHDRLDWCWINNDKACWAREARAIVDALPGPPQ